jgi:uncharacterized membrane protein YidH (DUF202 family)
VSETGPTPDVGSPNARTALAWQRTALALVGASAVVARLTFDRVGVLAVLVLTVALLLAVWVLLESRLRYVHAAGIRGRGRGRSGRAPAAVTVSVVLIGLVELVAVVTSPGTR